MPEPPPCRHLTSPAEGVELNRADAAGRPYLIFRDNACAGGTGVRCRQHIVVLPQEQDRVTVGRTVATDVSLSFDEEVSRAHCTLERVGSHWSLADNGLSRNGSFVNAERVRGSRILRHGDRLRVGNTTLTYRAPLAVAEDRDEVAARWAAHSISDAQRRVLVALCRPFRDDDRFATAPTNQEIAAALHLAVETVKAHLRALFDALGVEDLPQHQKRVRLVQRAFETGDVARDDLEDPAASRSS